MRFTRFQFYPVACFLVLSSIFSGCGSHSSSPTGALQDSGSVAPGVVDVSFGKSGLASATFNASVASNLEALTVDTSGNIVAAGATQINFPGEPVHFAVARFSEQGVLDTTLNGTGMVAMGVTTNNGGAQSVAVQANGKLVVGGYANNGQRDVFALARLNSDGTIDSTFGTSGKVVADAAGMPSYITVVAAQSDGKILVGGYMLASGYERLIVARFTSVGALDFTFGSNGVAIPNLNADSDAPKSVILNSDGTYWVALAFSLSNQESLAILKLNADGSVATSFGTNGVVTHSVSPSDVPVGLFAQSDGTWIAAVSSELAAPTYSVFRLLSDGSLDSTFGSKGVATVAAPKQGVAAAVVAEPDGKLLLGATAAGNNVANALWVYRFTSAGAVDTSFGQNGSTLVSNGISDTLRAMVISLDGKLILGSKSLLANGTYGFTLTRLGL